jgi:hypothetical protein
MSGRMINKKKKPKKQLKVKSSVNFKPQLSPQGESKSSIIEDIILKKTGKKLTMRERYKLKQERKKYSGFPLPTFSFLLNSYIMHGEGGYNSDGSEKFTSRTPHEDLPLSPGYRTNPTTGEDGDFSRANGFPTTTQLKLLISLNKNFHTLDNNSNEVNIYNEYFTLPKMEITENEMKQYENIALNNTSIDPDIRKIKIVIDYIDTYNVPLTTKISNDQLWNQLKQCHALTGPPSSTNSSSSSSSSSINSKEGGKKNKKKTKRKTKKHKKRKTKKRKTKKHKTHNRK